MISGKDIIHFSLDDYWKSDPHSRHHLANQFYQNKNRLFWVNSFGMRMPKIGKKGSISKLISKVRSYSKYIRQIKPDYWVFTPLALPMFGSQFLHIANNAFLMVQVAQLIRLFKIHNPIVFATSPMFSSVIARISKSLVIYYYSDKYTSYREIVHKEKIKAFDKDTLKLSDYVFCASRQIFHSLSSNYKNVFYLPHAVDFHHFNKAQDKYSAVPEDMKEIRAPIVGYFGSLTDSNDIGLIEYIAAKRPSYSIVLIGEPSPQYHQLKAYRNIYMLGRKKYEDLPQYGKHFNVCFMAWKKTEWIENCSPLKTREYLALGKPVVSYPINELKTEFANVVSIAHDKRDFLEKLDCCIENDSAEARQRRIASVRADTWESRFMQIANTIKSSRAI